MARRLSRRTLARYVVDGLLKNDRAVLQRLAAYLTETRRTKEASLIIRDVEMLLADRGTLIGTVTTAHPLSDGTLQELESSLRTAMKAEKVVLSREIDQSLIGGYKVALPGRELDDSVKHHLTTLRTRLKKV